MGYPRRGRALGQTLTRDQQWANLLASMDYVNAHPLTDSAGADEQQTRALLIASLVRAENALQGADQASADAAYTAAQQQYQQFAAAQKAKETPSALALWLANLGLDISNPIAKAAAAIVPYLIIGGVVYLLGPPIVKGMFTHGGSGRWE